MISRPAASDRWLFPGLGIVGIGILVALATDVAVTQLTPVKLGFVLGGLALLIPTLAMKNPKAYWLFLLVLTIPFDISKWFSAWLVDPQTLVDRYGQPASGTTAVELYLTDVVFVAMLLPWLVQVCIRRQRLYFPKIAYFFVFYLGWALLVSLFNADSLYLAMFELIRETLYFLFFIYLINNVTTPLEFRTVIGAMLLGFVISAATVIVFFELQIGTESSVFAALHDDPGTASQNQAYKPNRKASGNENLALYGTVRRFGLANRAGEAAVIRSQGMFKHPAIPASLCGLVLPIVLAYLAAARTNRARILLMTVFSLGLAALILTFSRAGAIGFAVGILVFFAVAGWSQLISRKALIASVSALAIVAVISIPLALVYFAARPGSVSMRIYLYEAALQGYLQHPILGAGLNNSTAAMAEGRQEMINLGLPMARTESVDSYYLAILIEVGPIGCILFFGFFAQIMRIALRTIKQAPTEMRPLLVGIAAGLASLATQSIADEPMAGHAISTSLWLFAALVAAAARQVPAVRGPVTA